MKQIAFFLSIFVSSVFLQAYGADGQSARSEAAQAQAGRATIAQEVEGRTDRQGRLSPEARAAIESGDLARMRALVSEDDRENLPDVQAFYCTADNCWCKGLADCMDLFETRICRGDFICHGTTGWCNCSFLIIPTLDDDDENARPNDSIRTTTPAIRAALEAGDYQRAISLLHRNQNFRGARGPQTAGQQSSVRQTLQVQPDNGHPQIPPDAQPFQCNRNSCDCLNVQDCIRLIGTGLCADRLDCGDNKCSCNRARVVAPSNPSTSSTILRGADRH
ncbi:hypothetical protein AB6B38_00220 [Glycocaulis abyssi]|uniref:Uncharacterized protein n=1 Tax=Glycocaulis abyssi TaxID=1433403 RepID=A0ABV9NAF5_9PROT